MPRIEAETASGVQVFDAEAGKKLVLAIEDAGIDILHRCGGNARCTTCRVEVLAGEAGEMQELERNRLAMENDLAANVRLSCQIRVQNDLKVHVVNQASVRGMDAGPRPFDD
jgi:ferredoxin